MDADKDFLRRYILLNRCRLPVSWKIVEANGGNLQVKGEADWLHFHGFSDGVVLVVLNLGESGSFKAVEIVGFQDEL